MFCAPHPDEGDFARFLLAQEIAWHHHSWGFSHTIKLAALLVAAEGRPEGVWLQWQAAYASFDTAFGLPRALLYAAGVERTLAHVRETERPDRAALLEELDEVLHNLRGDPEAAVAQALAAEPAEPHA